jgi:hypothetical protein
MNTIAANIVRPGVPARSWDTDLRRERRFFSGMAVAMALLCFVGFARSYYFKAHFGALPLSGLVHLHGIAFTLWIALLVVQTSLVAAGRTQLHRALGIGGAVLLVVMTGLAAAVAYARGSHVVPGVPHEPTLAFMAIAVISLLVFPTLIGTGLYLRKNAGAHKRLMLLGTAEIVMAAAGRLFNNPLVFFSVTDLFVVALVVYDFRSRGRLHPATLWGGLFFIASQPLRLMLAMSPEWIEFARWATGT